MVAAAAARAGAVRFRVKAAGAFEAARAVDPVVVAAKIAVRVCAAGVECLGRMRRRLPPLEAT